MHWHGIRQIGSPGMDGTPGVAQDGIEPGSSFTYTFTADAPGTYWCVAGWVSVLARCHCHMWVPLVLLLDMVSPAACLCCTMSCEHNPSLNLYCSVLVLYCCTAGPFRYHSHSGVEYMDGIRGALVVRDPTDRRLDDEVVTLMDW